MLRPYWMRVVQQRRRPYGDETESIPSADNPPPGTHMGDPDAALLGPSGEERVEGELDANFDGLDDPDLIPGDDKRDLPDKPPAKKEAVSKKKEEKPESKERKRDEPAPEPEGDEKAAEKKAEADKLAADKKAADEKAAADKKAAESKTAAEKKAAADKTAADKKEAEEKKELPKDDKDLDAIQPRPGSNPKVADDFTKLKEAVKSAREIARAAEKAKADLEKQLTTVKPLDEPTAKELESLREYYRIHEGANDPRFQEDWNGKEAAADTGLLNLLVTTGLPKETADKMKEIGLDKYSGQWWQKNIIEKIKDPIAQERVKRAILNRYDVKEQRQQAAEALNKDREKWVEQRQTAQKKWWDDWGAKVEDNVVKVANGHEWASKMDYPADATAEQKAAVDAHNAVIDNRAKDFAETTRKVAALDPATVSTVIFKSMHADVLKESLDATTKELTEAKSRVEELETELAAINNASRQRPGTRKEGDKKKGGYEPGKEMTADEAFAEAGI